MKHFLEKNKILILYFTLSLVILAFIFFVFALPWEVYFIYLGLSTVLFVLSMWYSYNRHRTEENLKDQLESLDQSFQDYKKQELMAKSDLKTYFLLWVHQVKSPLTSLNLMIQDLPSDQRALWQEKLIDIENYTNMALAYLKLTDPATVLYPISINLNDSVSEALLKYKTLFIKYHIKVDYDLEDVWVISDKNYLELLLEQLFSNISKYAREATCRISFDESHRTLYIEDTGIGIGPEDLPKIFDQGYSGFNGAYAEKSSGVGLFLVKKIADLLNIEIHVTSSLGEGTCFALTFPEEINPRY